MLTLRLATIPELSDRLAQPENSAIDGLVLGDEIAPRFFLELVLDKMNQYPEDSFWWSPRLILVDELVVGMLGFKSPPNAAGAVEIGYGIAASYRRRGFVTQAVGLLVQEGFAQHETKTIFAYTDMTNVASCKVLAKNQFVKVGNKFDPEDAEVWIWQRNK
jgi:RimJ/RimL family protein N-acetyltransferase